MQVRASELQAVAGTSICARLRKRPSTSELIDWIAVLKASGVKDLQLDETLPYLGALLKREQDMLALQEHLGGTRRNRA